MFFKCVTQLLCGRQTSHFASQASESFRREQRSPRQNLTSLLMAEFRKEVALLLVKHGADYVGTLGFGHSLNDFRGC